MVHKNNKHTHTVYKNNQYSQISANCGPKTKENLISRIIYSISLRIHTYSADLLMEFILSGKYLIKIVSKSFFFKVV